MPNIWVAPINDAAIETINGTNEREGAASSLHKPSDVRGDDIAAAKLVNLPPDLSDFVQFAWSTGLRKGAARQIAWNMVGKSEIRIPAGFLKNRRPHIIPLVGIVKEIVARRAVKRTMDSSLVFTWDKGNGPEPILEFRDTWRAACVKSGCGNMLFHDLRRSAVRDLMNAGVSQAVAMSISGHRTTSTFMRYQIVSTEDQARALERVQQYRAG